MNYRVSLLRMGSTLRCEDSDARNVKSTTYSVRSSPILTTTAEANVLAYKYRFDHTWLIIEWGVCAFLVVVGFDDRSCLTQNKYLCQLRY